MKKYLRFIAAIYLVALFVLAGCSSTLDEGVERQESVEKMYLSAKSKLSNKEYSRAAKEFDAVEQNYPYSEWATKSQVMAAYAHYRNLKYSDAIMALDRFIQLHPGDENTAYAYYLKALCFYEQISDVRRDQKMTELALKALRQVVSRFSGTKYARDASLKIDLAVDHIAGKHIEIGRYYLERKKYQAAINRFKIIVEQYQTTTHVAEALHRLVEAYMSLGITDEALKNAAILGKNYPQSEWYKDSYSLFQDVPQEKLEKNFVTKTFDKIFK